MTIVIILVVIVVLIIFICVLVKVVKKHNQHEKLIKTNETLEEKYKKLKLKIQIIPEKNRGSNLHELPEFSNVWKYLQKCVKNYSRSLADVEGKGRCIYCNQDYRIGLIECHEEWEWDIDIHVQKLKRVVPICPFCHNVVHFGHDDERFKRLAYSWLKSINYFNNDESVAYREYIFGIKRKLYDPIDFKLDKTSILPVEKWASKYERL